MGKRSSMRWMGGAFGAALTMVLTLAACGTAPTPPPGPDGGAEARCESNADCGGGQICRGNVCRTSCEVPADCEPSLPVCDTTAGYCVECNADAECGRDEACTENECTFYCRADAACADTEYCVTETGACAARECESTADCRGGYRCDRFVCVPIDDIVCEAGQSMCSGGNTAVLSCNADGTMETSETCASGSVCVAEGTTARCAAVVCAPGELGCVDDRTAFVCDATGTMRATTACSATQYCEAGACTAQACTPGSVVCEGEGVLSCDARGASSTFEPCASRPECAGNPYGCACAGSACVARVCTPGSRRCAADGFQVCAADGRSWGGVTSCAGTETCVAGACLPTACAAGSRACMGDVLVECNATGTARTTTDCAASSQLCTGTGAGAACTARVCVPGALSCNVARDAVVMCDARGAAAMTTACPSGTYCNGGRCDARMCTPGSVSQCVAGDVQQCNALGSGYLLVTDCSAAQTCVDAAGGATCRTRICTAGTARCGGETLYACAADGLSETPTDCAAGSRYCDAATTSCQPWVCTPAAVSCSGNNVVTCNARGSASSVTATCSATLGCSGGACVVGCGDGIVQAARGETCDDGNTTSGDGCSSACAIEACGALSLPSRGGYAQVGDAAPLRLASTSFTIEMWAFATNVGDGCNNVLAAKRGAGRADGWFLSVRGPACSSSGRLFWNVSGAGDPELASSVSAPLGRWFHVAVTFDRATNRVTLWLDGANVGTMISAAPSATATAPLRLGQDTGGSDYGWLGQLDDVRISNVVRYTGSFTPPARLAADGQTIAFWSFDERSGTTASDRGPSGYTATLQSGATWGTVSMCTH